MFEYPPQLCRKFTPPRLKYDMACEGRGWIRCVVFRFLFNGWKSTDTTYLNFIRAIKYRDSTGRYLKLFGNNSTPNVFSFLYSYSNNIFFYNEQSSFPRLFPSEVTTLSYRFPIPFFILTFPYWKPYWILFVVLQSWWLLMFLFFQAVSSFTVFFVLLPCYYKPSFTRTIFRILFSWSSVGASRIFYTHR